MTDFGVGFGIQVGPKSDKKAFSKIDRTLDENQILREWNRGAKSKVCWVLNDRHQTTDCRPATENRRSEDLQQCIEDKQQDE